MKVTPAPGPPWGDGGEGAGGSLQSKPHTSETHRKTLDGVPRARAPDPCQHPIRRPLRHHLAGLREHAWTVRPKIHLQTHRRTLPRTPPTPAPGPLRNPFSYSRTDPSSARLRSV